MSEVKNSLKIVIAMTHFVIPFIYTRTMNGDELQVIRYFRIDEEIRAGNKPNAKRLSQILHVSERSIHRYISEMRYEMNTRHS